MTPNQICKYCGMQHPFLTDVVCNAKKFNKINLPYIFENNNEPYFAMQINLKPTHAPIVAGDIKPHKFNIYNQNHLAEFRSYMVKMAYRRKI